MGIELSRRVQVLKPSAPLATVEKARVLRERGIDVVDFSAGQPDFDTPQDIKDAAVAALAAGDTKYPTPVVGKTPLREAVCTYLRRYCALEYEAAQVCVTVGAKDALHLAFASLVNPGDEVVIPVPYWVSYPEQVRLVDGTPVFVEGCERDGSKITGETLRAALTPRTRVLVLNSPSNPSGAVYSRAELEQLAAAVRAHPRVVVLSDEMYHRLLFTNEPYTSFALLPGMKERTLTINGFSKTFAMTGWRLGFAAGPTDLIAAMGRVQGQTTSGATSFVQTAAVQALNGEQEFVETMRAAFRARGEKMHAALSKLPGVKSRFPDGAFYCFPDVSATFAKLGVKNSTEFADAALEQAHVALVSGEPFGSATHVRLSFATSIEQIERGMEKLARWLG